MTRRVVEKLCTKKVCVDFLAPIKLNSCKMGVSGRFQGYQKHACAFMRSLAKAFVQIKQGIFFEGGGGDGQNIATRLSESF